ncbi:MAG: DUF5658 family protein [Chloroflexota bacterium]
MQVNQLVARTLNNRLVWLFLFLQLMDALTTSVGLSFGAVERNTMAAQWFGIFGPNLGPLTLKMTAGLVLIGILTRCQMNWPRENLHWQVLAGANALYGLVVISNFSIIALQVLA